MVVSIPMKDWHTSVTNVANRLYVTLWAAREDAYGRYHHVHMAPSVDSVLEEALYVVEVTMVCILYLT